LDVLITISKPLNHSIFTNELKVMMSFILQTMKAKNPYKSFFEVHLLKFENIQIKNKHIICISTKTFVPLGLTILGFFVKVISNLQWSFLSLSIKFYFLNFFKMNIKVFLVNLFSIYFQPIFNILTKKTHVLQKCWRENFTLKRASKILFWNISTSILQFVKNSILNFGHFKCIGTNSLIITKNLNLVVSHEFAW